MPKASTRCARTSTLVALFGVALGANGPLRPAVLAQPQGGEQGIVSPDGAIRVEPPIKADEGDYPRPSRLRSRPAAERSPLAIESVLERPGPHVLQFGKLELDIELAGIAASKFDLPFDESSPPGAPGEDGISVEAVLEGPDGSRHTQPAFHYQRFIHQIVEGRDWIYPSGEPAWKVRFTPDVPGVWRYRVVARDQGGSASTQVRSFTVAPAAAKGFIGVSQDDSRYFEFDDGSPFYAAGLQLREHLDSPETKARPQFEALGRGGVSLVRIWASSVYGSAWHPLVGARNQYRGYLPTIGLLPTRGDGPDEHELALRIDYEEEGDTGWFDACRIYVEAVPVKPHAYYRIAVEYKLDSLQGPREGPGREHGLVAKLGGWHSDCFEPETGTVVTPYGKVTGTWSTTIGVWQSGDEYFLPRLHLALENVTAGEALIRSLSVREIYADGSLGPEVLDKPLMAMETYVSQAKSYGLDRIVEYAEAAGVRLKIVLLELNDEIWLKFDDDGSYLYGPEDNLDGFYGMGREINKTRWLQRAWWRYAQARWGYSTAVHSWELLNEGDPNSVAHYEMADALGKYMHRGVFEGAAPDIINEAGRERANAHLVTTSFWHSFPADEFWNNPSYPDIDYADVHAYVSTSFAGDQEKESMSGDAAWYHIWHSAELVRRNVGKPIMRGEAGLDAPHEQSPFVLDLDRDTQKTWLHNYLWSTLDAGGLMEIYWWQEHVSRTNSAELAPFLRLSRFLEGIRLNAGGYQDWGGSVTNQALRVVGQKNPAIGEAHLWIQNRLHTWRSVVEGRQPPPESGQVLIPGFPTDSSLVLEWHDTRSNDASVAKTEVRAFADGVVRLDVQSLVDDVAVKIRPAIAE